MIVYFYFFSIILIKVLYWFFLFMRLREGVLSLRELEQQLETIDKPYKFTSARRKKNQSVLGVITGSDGRQEEYYDEA